MHSLRRAVPTLAFVVAACGGGGGIAAPTAPAPVVTALTVSAPPEVVGTLYVGGTYQFTAIERLADGSMRTANATWTTTNPTVARVDSRGVVEAIGPGTVTITASNGTMTATGGMFVRVDFAGRWRGTFTVTSCSTTAGRMICLPPMFPVGSVHPITFDLGAVDRLAHVNFGVLTIDTFSDPKFQAQGNFQNTGMADLNTSTSGPLTSPAYPGWFMYRFQWRVYLGSLWDLQGEFQLRVVSELSIDSGDVFGRIDHLIRQ